ncbi:MAG: hypothetical protein J1F20_05815 [Muribaculaceae bacterium]|nr:hypothetical protein [Muribaculaceae bacterium]
MMNKIIASLFLSGSCLCGVAQGMDLPARINTFDCKQAHVRYEVLLPSAADPVAYDIELTVVNTPDSYSECAYLIDWKLPRGNKLSQGFSSYCNGDHFRYRDSRLQEYHVVEDSIPFTADGGGVARNSQFADILPPFIAKTIAAMANDSTYTYSFDEPRGVLSGSRTVNGYDALEFTYTFDTATWLPLEIDFVYNPASISEQFVNAKYTWSDVAGDCPSINEEYLMERYGDIFEKYRTSNFKADNLPGTAMPTFSYIVPGAGRMSHSRGENDLAQPVLMSFIDSDVASTPQALAAVESALQAVPFNVTGVYVFRDGNKPDDASLTESLPVVNGEDSLIRKCGITVYPTFLLINTDGTVSSVIQGVSTDLISDLSQSMMLLH